MFEISSYYFYKVIEVLVRVEDGLSRDVVKHLNHVSSEMWMGLFLQDIYFAVGAT